ncbi:ABC transporter permease [Nocardioides sp. NPDC126508]
MAVLDPHHLQATTGAWRQLRGDRWALMGAALVAGFVLLAALAPLLTALSHTDPYTYDIEALDTAGVPTGMFGGVSGAHWLGVEPQTGRDLFAILAYGARTSLLVGLGATTVSVAVGTVVGIVAGYTGGFADVLLSRFTDLMLAFPSLIFMIALGAIVPSSFPKPLFIVLVIGAFGWPSVARVVRGLTLTLRTRDFVLAARAIGAPTSRILRAEIWPNLASSVTVLATMAVPGAITAEAALSFLGIGVTPPTPSWGRTIANAVSWIQVDPWYLLAPGAALFLLTLGFNMLGDGLRDAYDPRVSGSRG